MPRQSLNFYCVQTKETFNTDSYGVHKAVKGKRTYYYAITEHMGVKCFRILSKQQYMRLKKQ